jgi:tetratricopeptide (TPR) repeat protein
MIVRFVACVGLFTLVVTPAKAWCSGQIAGADACKVGPIPERIRNADRQREETIFLCRPDSALLIENRRSTRSDGDRRRRRHQLPAGRARSAARCIFTTARNKGEVAGALNSYKKAFAILDRRAKSDPENTKLQRGLSRILSSIASLQVLTGNRTEARATYDKRLAIEDKLASKMEKAEVQFFGKASPGTASAFLHVAWYALLARKPTKALMAARQALAITPNEPWIRINLAHALLLLGRTTKARALYEQVAAIPNNNKPWKQVVVEDFGKLRKAGVTHSLMPTIEAALDR